MALNKQQRSLFIALVALVLVVLIVLVIILVTGNKPAGQVFEPTMAPITSPAPAGTADPLAHLSEDEVGKMAIGEEEGTDFSQLFEQEEPMEPSPGPTGPID